jgi:hypothetical protein
MHVFGNGCAFLEDSLLQLFEVFLDDFSFGDILLEALDNNFA